MNEKGYKGDITPKQAWQILKDDSKSYLIDCRSLAEWSFVGVPDLSELNKTALFVEWQSFPHMRENKQFYEQLRNSDIDADDKLIFICRSGCRSGLAARAMTAAGFKNCFNIENGFEGDHDEKGQRGKTSGWKADNLPWRQE